MSAVTGGSTSSSRASGKTPSSRSRAAPASRCGSPRRPASSSSSPTLALAARRSTSTARGSSRPATEPTGRRCGRDLWRPARRSTTRTSPTFNHASSSRSQGPKVLPGSLDTTTRRAIAPCGSRGARPARPCGARVCTRARRWSAAAASQTSTTTASPTSSRRSPQPPRPRAMMTSRPPPRSRCSRGGAVDRSGDARTAARRGCSRSKQTTAGSPCSSLDRSKIAPS